MTARGTRAAAAGWAVFVAAHLAIGAWEGGRRLIDHTRFLSYLPAVDWWLTVVGRFEAGGAEVSALLARVPPRDDVMVVQAPVDSRFSPPWPFVSYLAWPRRAWVFQCASGEMQPTVWAGPRGDVWPDPQSVAWILFFDRQPPPGLRRIASAGRLTLAAAHPAVPWRSYCSP